MIDYKSILGYQKGSPYANNPYLDINSPNGLISMENTPHDVLGRDNKGNIQRMKAGRKKPYKFSGNIVRETPIRQKGGMLSAYNPYLANSDKAYQKWYNDNNIAQIENNDYDFYSYYRNGNTQPHKQGDHFPDIYKLPNHETFSNESIYSVPEHPGGTWKGNTYIPVKKFQKGGYSRQDLYNYLFEDDDKKDESIPTAPAEDEIKQQEPRSQDNSDELAYQVAGQNPYKPRDYTTGNSAKYAYNYFQQKGIPSHLAAGIVGNLIQESGNFRPDVIAGERTGDNGAAKGIAQWHSDRWNSLLSYANQTGKNPYTLDFQLDYVLHEAQQRGDLNAISGSRNAEEAAYTFAKRYERPKIVDPNRIRYAKQLNQ